MPHPLFTLMRSGIILGFAAAALAQRPARTDNRFPADRGYTGDLSLLVGEPNRGARTEREFFLKLVHRPAAPAGVEMRDTGNSDGIVQRAFTFARDPEKRVPGLWYQPAQPAGPLPVVIILHGTGGNKEGMKVHLETYARAGFVAIAIDGPYHGERSRAGKGSADYQDAILRAWRQPGSEHPFFYDTVWDVMRLIDWVSIRPEIDGTRIGLTGFSKGGIEAYLAAAIDRRVAVAVSYIGVQSFGWALANNAWQSRVSTIQKAVDAAAKESGAGAVDAAFVRKFYRRVAPGIESLFDGPRMLPLVAPRPLLVINGDSDPRTPMPGVQECLQRAHEKYAEAGAAERLQFIAQRDTGHKVTPEAHAAGLEWFKRWLLAEPVKP